MHLGHHCAICSLVSRALGSCRSRAITLVAENGQALSRRPPPLQSLVLPTVAARSPIYVQPAVRHSPIICTKHDPVRHLGPL
jgi:hypothetical protein